MDRRFFLAASAALAAAACSRSESPPARPWAIRVATEAGDSVQSIAVDDAGNFAVAGYTEGSATCSVAYFEKHDAAGALMWHEEMGNGPCAAAYSVAFDRDGSVLVVGDAFGFFEPSTGFASKTTGDGVRRWTVELAAGTIAYSVATDAPGNAYVAGSVDGALEDAVSQGARDAYVRKYSPDGATLWTRQFGTQGNDEAWSVATAADGGVFVVGDTDGSFDGAVDCCDEDLFVARYDADGALLWTRQLGTTNDDGGLSVAVDADGSVFVGGYTTGALGGWAKGNEDAVLVKLDPAGDTLWIAQLGSWSNDFGFSVAAAGDGGAYLAGSAGFALWALESLGRTDAFVARYAADGAMLWVAQFGTAEHDHAHSVATDPAGHVFVGGVTMGALDGVPSAGREDGFVVSYGADGARR